MQRIDSQDHQTGINSIKGLVEEQNREIKKLLDDFHLRFHQSEELILRVSKVNVESVHNQLREKLGCYYCSLTSRLSGCVAQVCSDILFLQKRFSLMIGGNLRLALVRLH